MPTQTVFVLRSHSSATDPNPGADTIVAAVSTATADTLQAEADAIVRANPNSVMAGIRRDDWGTWLGAPTVLITRPNGPLAPSDVVVTAVWQFPDTAASLKYRDLLKNAIGVHLQVAFEQGVPAALRDRGGPPAWVALVIGGVLAGPLGAVVGYSMQRSLDTSSTSVYDWTAGIMNYDPVVNGPVSGWVNGTAGRSRTRNEPASPLQLDHVENPLGPTDPNLAPTTISERAGAALNTLTIPNINALMANASNLLRNVAYVALAVGAVYVGYKVVQARRGAPQQAPRALPARARAR